MRATMLGAEILRERRRRGAERAEHEPGERLDAQPARRVLLRLAVGRHAALAGNAAAERDPGELAGEIVGPVVIDADDLARLAALLEAQQRAAMGAAVLEGVDDAVGVAGHHHRHVAEIGERKLVRRRQFRFKAQEGPGVAAEDALLLLAHRDRGRSRANRERGSGLRPARAARFSGCS